eukprot:7329191-Pyramimonas_sp.AAC.1
MARSLWRTSCSKKLLDHARAQKQAHVDYLARMCKKKRRAEGDAADEREEAQSCVAGGAEGESAASGASGARTSCTEPPAADP